MGRYYVQASDGLIVGAPTDPSLDNPPAGATTQVIPDAEEARNGGTWANGVYVGPANQPTLAAIQKRRLHVAYKHFQIYGRTEHWHHLRSGVNAARPLVATDKWAYQIPAVGYNIIEEIWPLVPLSDEDKEVTINWLIEVLTGWGPTWYSVMVAEDAETDGGNAADYATQDFGQTALYTDTVKADGSTRPLDGAFLSGRGNFPTGYNPELAALVNP